MIKILTNDKNGLALIRVHCKNPKYYARVRETIENTVKCYSMNTWSEKFPDRYIWEKELYYLSFFYTGNDETAKIGSGLFNHTVGLYNILKNRLISHQAYISISLYSVSGEIIGYRNKCTSEAKPLDIKKHNSINIVKELIVI